MNVYGKLKSILDAGNGASLISRYGDGVARSINCGDWSYRGNSDGSPALLVERFSPQPRFVLLGGGHVAVPLCELASNVGFSVTVYDDRPDFANRERFPKANEIICDGFSNIARLFINKSDYVAIVTRGHRHDALCLRTVFNADMPFYLGMIGSSRKLSALKEMLLDEGIDGERFNALHSPIGLSIGAVTPYEIAVSVVAEMIAKRRLHADGGMSSDCDDEVIEWLAEHGGEKCAAATVVGIRGSAPRGLGAKIIVLPHGGIIGSIGGGCAEAEVRRTALDIAGTGARAVVTVDLTHSAEQDGMVCGGVMDVLIEDMTENTTEV